MNIDHYTIGTTPTISNPEITGTPATGLFQWYDTPTPPCQCGYTGGHYRTTHFARMLLLRYGWERRSSF